MVVLASVLFGLACLAQTTHANTPATVHTNYGDVLGYETDLARVFYGIPFAQPPVDTLRWNPPVPVSKWSPNVLNATHRPAACPQPPCGLSPDVCPYVFSEDCLYLNIFTPLLPSDTSSPSPLPVMIFISGGNFQFLDGSAPVYNSEHLVNTTNVIVAFIQYRLGVLGFFATGMGPNDLKGNYGILDQRLAIAWIKANIDAFGGDPNQITLFGQSAGAQSTALHYVTEEMQSFFQQAIIQSAPMSIPFRTYMEYVTPGVLLAEQLHCNIGDIVCFRARSADDIVAAQSVVDNMVTSFDILLFFEPWVPVIDNVIVHGQLMNIVGNTSFPLKPLIIGTVTEEALFFVYQAWNKPLTPTLYAELILATFQERALKVIERYPPDGLGDQRTLLARMATQWVFSCSTRVFARKAASYFYAFGFPFDFDGWGNSSFCNGHVCHGGDVPYTFESGWMNFTDAGRRVSQSMGTYWTNFAKSQDPNEPLRVPLSWPRVTTGNEQYLYFQDPLQVKEDYLKKECDFWDEIGYKYTYIF